MMLAEVPQVLSGFLPSPSTAYDKAAGGIETGPESMAVLESSKRKGVVVTVVMAGAVTMMAWSAIGPLSLLLFAAAMATLWFFLNDFNSAIRRGYEAAGNP